MPSARLQRRVRRLLGVFGVTAVVHFASRSVPPVSALLGLAEPRFKFEGLIDVGGLGLEAVDGLVAAVGDLDGEQFLELFILDAEQRSVSLYQWNKAKYTFQPVPGAQPISAPFRITNVVPGDYDYDGRLDVLLMGQANPGGWWADDELKMLFYRGLGGGSFAPPVQVRSSGLPQPMPMDAGGDLRVDLLGVVKNDETEQQSLRLWKNVWRESNLSSIFTLADAPLNGVDFNCEIPDTHSNAFIDLDGDCLADLFLVCKDPTNSDRLTYQIWINTKTTGFKLAQKGQLPAGVGQISFADMDRDGTLDMVFPTCTPRDGCNVNIVYNQQMPLCTTTGGLTTTQSRVPTKDCRDVGNLCVADPQFNFDMSESSANSGFQRSSLTSLVPAAPYMILEDKAFRGSLPNPIRIGDYNKDGYPDLLVVTSASTSAQQGVVSLLESVPCTTKECSKAVTSASRRSFSRVDGPTAEALNKITDAKSAMWIDLDEDGSLDILVQRVGKAGGSSRTLSFIRNNYYHDAFFLKTLVGNGACDGMCIGANGSRYHPYGVSYSGASYKFTVLDTSGVRKATQVGQLPQTGYLSLQTPYSYFGLGRTNNYVENLFVGSTRHQDEHYMSIEGLIPNSQVVIVPYQPADVHTPATWERQLFLQPGKWIPWVGVALLGSLLILSTIVLVLHVNEKRQDELERRKAQHLINFDAL